jgi:hypothetical protein
MKQGIKSAVNRQQVFITQTVAPLSDRGTPEMGESLSKREQLLMFEYERAQEMLIHSDSLIWQIGSILIAGTLVLTGLALNKDTLELLGKGWRSLLAVIGVPTISFLTLKIWLLWARRHRSFYNFREQVLQRIEFELQFYHFLRVLEASQILNILADAEKKVDIDKNVKTVLSLEQLILIYLDGVKGRTNPTPEQVENEDVSRWLREQDKRTVDALLEKFSGADEDLSKLQRIIGAKFDVLRELKEAKARAGYGFGKFRPMSKIEYSGPSGYKVSWYLTFGIPIVQFTFLLSIWSINMYDRTRPWYPQPWRQMYYHLEPAWVVSAAAKLSVLTGTFVLIPAITVIILVAFICIRLLWKGRPDF